MSKNELVEFIAAEADLSKAAAGKAGYSAAGRAYQLFG